VKLYGKKHLEEKTEEKKGEEIRNENGTLKHEDNTEFFDLKEHDSMFLRNVGKILSDYTALRPKTWYASSDYGLLGYNTLTSALKMETAGTSETLVPIYQAMRRHI
jgi:hypothetical protein